MASIRPTLSHNEYGLVHPSSISVPMVMHIPFIGKFLAISSETCIERIVGNLNVQDTFGKWAVQAPSCSKAMCLKKRACDRVWH